MEGGGHGILPAIVRYVMREGEGEGQAKNKPNNRGGGGFQRLQEKNLKSS